MRSPRNGSASARSAAPAITAAGFVHKAGVAAFQCMLDALAEGYSIALSADVPKVARVAGLGIIKLAQMSGRPIYPGAIATSRRIVLDNWDRTTINLPFGRGAGVAAEPVQRAAPTPTTPRSKPRADCSKTGSIRRRNAPTTRRQAAAAQEADRGRPPAAGVAPLSIRVGGRDAAGAATAGAAAQSRQGTSRTRLPERRGEASLPRPAGR